MELVPIVKGDGFARTLVAPPGKRFQSVKLDGVPIPLTPSRQRVDVALATVTADRTLAFCLEDIPTEDPAGWTIYKSIVRRFVVVGDAVTMVFSVLHDLNTDILFAEVWDLQTNEEVIVHLIRQSEDELRVDFAFPPDLGERYEIVLSGFFEELPTGGGGGGGVVTRAGQGMSDDLAQNKIDLGGLFTTNREIFTENQSEIRIMIRNGLAERTQVTANGNLFLARNTTSAGNKTLLAVDAFATTLGWEGANPAQSTYLEVRNGGIRVNSPLSRYNRPGGGNKLNVTVDSQGFLSFDPLPVQLPILVKLGEMFYGNATDTQYNVPNRIGAAIFQLYEIIQGTNRQIVYPQPEIQYGQSLYGEHPLSTRVFITFAAPPGVKTFVLLYIG